MSSLKSCGGGAAASLPTFSGCVKKAQTSHLAQSTQICLKFKKNSPGDKIATSVESFIRTNISFELTLTCTEESKL